MSRPALGSSDMAERPVHPAKGRQRSLPYKRFSAFLIDYGLVVLYALVLLSATLLFSTGFDVKLEPDPYTGQLIGFLTLTLPTVLYFDFTEKSKWQGTIGKRIQKLRVVTASARPARRILVRNILKFLPWEVAHTGVHWSIYYDDHGLAPPQWTWLCLVVPQAVVLIYGISILTSKGRGSLYDRLAGTMIVPMEGSR